MAEQSRVRVRPATRVAGFADIGQLISATALRRADAVALDDGTRTLTYAAFEARANRAAQALLAQGFQPGDRIAVLAENRLEYLELAVAAARTGTILCALNWRFSSAELAHCVRLTRPRFLFVSDRHAPALGDLDLDGIVTIRFGDAYEALLAPAASDAPTPIADPEDGLSFCSRAARPALRKPRSSATARK
jgi:fatty-acyl-CoA synthase